MWDIASIGTFQAFNIVSHLTGRYLFKTFADMQVRNLLHGQEVSNAEHKQQLASLKETVSVAFDRFARKQTTVAQLVSELSTLGVDVAMPQEAPEPDVASMQQPQLASEAETPEPEPR